MANSLWWYISPLKIKIVEELSYRPDLVKQLGHFKEKFIRWCCNQRIIYEPDLEDEVTEFSDKYIKNRLVNIDVNLWLEIRTRIFTRDNYTCCYCGQKGHSLEVDHIIPLSKGGTNDENNLITACRKCNRQKHDKTYIEFLNWRVEHNA